MHQHNRTPPGPDQTILTAFSAITVIMMFFGHLVAGIPGLITGATFGGAGAVGTYLLRRRGDRARRGLVAPDAMMAQLNRCLAGLGPGAGQMAALVVEFDQFRLIEERHGADAAALVLQQSALRLESVLRDSDLAATRDGRGFAIILGPSDKLNLDAVMFIAGRVQRALSEPLRDGKQGIHLSVSVGFALAGRLIAPRGDDLLQAATLALHEAQRSGPGAIRSYSDAMKTRVARRNSLADDVAGALERGEILPFYQPQIDSATGAVSGFEALARWVHPSRGMISPAEFLPAIEQAGLHDRLGAAMLSASLRALRGWDQEGLAVPRVGVNFSGPELANPQLVNRILWELETLDLAPNRLVIEVLETVVATRSEDAVIRNLAGLARLGCRVDLDDFGTGHASITTIRRFAIERIKIDRSFVTKIDEDGDQQKMVSAILTMAERLGLGTLAEGVETPAERAVLTSMGCGHLQGFGIARPMALADATAWLMARRDQTDNGTILHLPRRA
jgi:diguanylate cyclase (GGDEF)-like protein